MAVNLIKHFSLKNSAFDERGFSSIESIILMVCFTLMVTFTFGVFGIIHTGILQSIGSRNYAFETFRHRANLTYLRDADKFGGATGEISLDSYTRTKTVLGDNFRIHFDVNEHADDGKQQPAERPISKGRTLDAVGHNTAAHVQLSNEANLAAGKRYNNQDGVTPAWIKVAYGICMNADCQ